MPETEIETKTREELAGMSFVQHLEELRRRIIYSLLAIATTFFVGWWKADRIFAFMQGPIITALHAHKLEEKLVYTNPTDPFNMYMKVAFIAGLFIASPFVLYQVWAFFAPALTAASDATCCPSCFRRWGCSLRAAHSATRWCIRQRWTS